MVGGGGGGGGGKNFFWGGGGGGGGGVGLNNFFRGDRCLRLRKCFKIFEIN